MMTLEAITEQFRSRLATAPPLNAKILFDCGESGQVFVDATKTPAEFSTLALEEPVLTLSANLDVFANILAGTQDPNFAYMTGKLKVKGPLGLAMKLNGILEG
ncbi:MAG: SCP2 sterol-binding domain-containing protein [Alphaproteobacteria bacterium]|nr:SCP2 sterol-binding domain-containing protein [Alphaproteobacteria bacterium]